MTSNPNPAVNGLPDELHPCEHLVTLVSRRADGTLSGPAKWYMDLHVLTCPHCREAIKGLRLLRVEVAERVAEGIVEVPLMKAEDWERIEKSWSEGAQR